MSRLLAPEDFGILSLAQIFSLIVSMVMEMGLSSAIIQRKEISKREIDVVFTYNFLIVAFFTFVLWICAPFVAAFYSTPNLVIAIRIICVQLIFSGLSVIPMALMYRQSKFKEVMIVNSIGAVLGAIVSIILALKGFGFIALAAQGSITAAAMCFMFYQQSASKPGFNFRFKDGIALFSFSYKIFLSTLLNQIFQKLDVLIFGRFYPLSKVGHFNRASSLDSIIRSFSSSSILNVLLPRISKMQGDQQAIKMLYIHSLNLLCFLFFLLATIVFFNAPVIVSILFGQKWMIVSELLRLLLIATFAYPVSSLMLSVIEGMGYAGLFLKLELVKKVVAIPFLILPFFVSMETYLLALGLLAYLGVIVNSVGVARVIDVSWISSIKCVLSYNAAAVLSLLCIFLVQRYLHANQLIEHLIGTIVSVILYIGIVKLLRLDGLPIVRKEVVKILERQKL